MSVLLLKALGKPRLSVLDGLAAAGAFGIRAALEVPGTAVSFNDKNPLAVGLLRRNVALNGIKTDGIYEEPLQARLSSARYDFVDVDPFGTPVPYIDSAFQSARSDGIVAVTATDTAVLCGAQPRACLRRYEARPLHTDFCKEVGLRILIGYCTRTAAKHDKAVTPLLSFGADHYMRAFMRVEHGAGKADKSLACMGYASFNRQTGKRHLADERPSDSEWAGPLWAGGLWEADVVRQLSPPDYMGHETSLLVQTIKEELTGQALYVTTDFLARLLKCSPPPMDVILDALKSSGLTATRTHFDPAGIRTNAPWEELLAVYRRLSS